MGYKAILSGVAIALTLLAFYPYLRDILKGVVKPHVFSWIIWASTTLIVFFAQLQDGGGAGAWAIGVSGCITLVIAFLAYIQRADVAITLVDQIVFAAAMSSLPLWYLTSDPMWAVVLLTVIDVLGFGPTLRKAYACPYSESMTFFALFLARNLIVILALEHYSVTTVMFPALVAMACGSVVLVIALRRKNWGPV